MNFAAMILPQRMIEALGWTLFHALWQGALAALGFAVALYFTRRASARLRYGLGLAALALILLLSLSTFWNHYAAAAPAAAAGAPRSAAVIAAASPAALPQGESAPGQRLAAFFSDYFARHLPLLVTLWLLGVLFLTLRFTGGMLYVRRLKYRQNRPLAGPWQERLQKLAARAGLRRPLRLLESLRLNTPVVVGHLKPVLLLPVGLVTGLPADEVEALLAHELAHIMRRDYLVNVAQHLVEILYFFHPAVRWLSACVRQEREHCCDDFAVELCGDPRSYARALARLQVSAAGSVEPALAAVGRPRLLLRRITRLLAGPRLAHDFREGFLCALLLGVGLLGLLKLSAFAGAPAAAGEAKPKPAPAAKAPTAGRFARVSFALETGASVKLSGESVNGAGGSQGTWLVDDSDGQVVWYMDLSSRAKAGNASFSEEVALGRGSYSWYRPAGWKATAQWKPTGGKGAWAPLTMLVGGERPRRGRDAGEDLLKIESHEQQQAQEAARKYLLQADREQKRLEEELRKQEAELQAAQGAERELKQKELQKLEQETRAKVETMRVLKEKELQEYELQMQKKDAERRELEAQMQLQEKEMQARLEEQKALEQAQQGLQEHELQMQAKEAERRELEAQMQLQEKEMQLHLEEKKALEHAQQELREKEAELKRQRQEAERQSVQMRKFNEFFRDLIKKQGLVTREGRYEIKLSASVLLINGKPQPAAVLEEFRKFYESLSGKKLDAATPITFVQGSE